MRKEDLENLIFTKEFDGKRDRWKQRVVYLTVNEWQNNDWESKEKKKISKCFK